LFYFSVRGASAQLARFSTPVSDVYAASEASKKPLQGVSTESFDIPLHGFSLRLRRLGRPGEQRLNGFIVLGL